MKRYLMVAALAAVLAGCSSGVKLDPPIQGSGTTGADASATTGATGQGAGQSTVKGAVPSAARAGRAALAYRACEAAGTIEGPAAAAPGETITASRPAARLADTIWAGPSSCRPARPPAAKW